MHLSVKTISIAPTLCQVCTEFWGHKMKVTSSPLKISETSWPQGAVEPGGTRWMLEKITRLMSKAGAKFEF